MTWIYNSPLGTDKDRIRWLVGDTDANRQLVQDEEIAWVLTQERNVYAAAAAVCEQLAARGREVRSESVGDLSVTYDPAVFEARARSLRARGLGYATPTSADTSKDAQRTLKEDTDWPQPQFEVGMHDNPMLGGTRTDEKEQP